MKILLTGHHGFIGQHMHRKLLSLGYDVVTYEWHETELPSVTPDLDCVMHIGAISSTVEKDVDKVMRQNYDFTRWLFDQCRLHNVRLQYSSSASVYGIVSSFREDSPLDPKNPYAWSKYLCERYHLQNQGANIVQGFRYFNVYGPEGEEHKGNQASPHAKFKEQYETTGIVHLFENSQRYERDFVHVSEIVDLHLKFLNVHESGVWNFGTGKSRSFYEVATKIAPKSAITYVPMPDILKGNYQSYTCADMTKTQTTLEKWLK
jgi:ADP-L-glycero-D-manno-heptose 6-epimerase